MEDISQLSLKSEGGVAIEQCSERLLTMKMEEVVGHKLRKVGDLWKLEKNNNNKETFSSRPSRRKETCCYLEFSTVRTVLDL